MSWYEDLTPCDYFRLDSNLPLAVGWLDHAHAYPKGLVDPRVVRALMDIAANPWQPTRYLGARGAMPRATSLGLFAEGSVAETCSTPGTAAFRRLALDENSGARSRDALHHGLLGWHDCDFCEVEYGPESFWFEDQRVDIGTANLFIPSLTGVLVAPTMILHYIHDHGYHPPGHFMEAVLACPQMGSPEYFDALTKCGGQNLIALGSCQ